MAAFAARGFQYAVGGTLFTMGGGLVTLGYKYKELEKEHKRCAAAFQKQQELYTMDVNTLRKTIKYLEDERMEKEQKEKEEWNKPLDLTLGLLAFVSGVGIGNQMR